MGGVGKTALAVTWAHRIRSRFPGGNLYLNLRAHDPDGAPSEPGEALGKLLRGLGVADQQIPVDVDERGALYRSLLAERRMLVVADNVRDSNQIRSLLPGSSGCVLLVTSRRRLDSLIVRESARSVTLDVLTIADATSLLRELIGHKRAATDPEAIKELTRLCGRLPLALRITAGRITGRSSLSLARVASELAQARLDFLRTVDDDPTTAVRTVFFWSYRALPPDQAHLFRLLGLAGGQDISTTAAAKLINMMSASAEAILERLAAAHLVEENSYVPNGESRGHADLQESPRRWHMHDLMRAYAAELVETDEEISSRRAAIGRLTTYYLDSALSADRALRPHLYRGFSIQDAEDQLRPAFPSARAALDWYDAESTNLVAAINAANRYEFYAQTWRLSDSLYWFFDRRKHWDQWIQTHETALTAARKMLDRSGEAIILSNLGVAYASRGLLDTAITQYGEALAGFRETGDRLREGLVLNALGNAYFFQRRFDDAVSSYQHALNSVDGNRHGEAHVLNGLGMVYTELGRHDEAITCHLSALNKFRIDHDRHGEAHALYDLGMVYCRSGQYDLSLRYSSEAVEQFRDVGDLHSVAHAISTVGTAYSELGRFDEAFKCHRHALDRFRETGYRRGEGHVCIALGKARAGQGRLDEAAAHCQDAIERFREIEDRFGHYGEALASDELGKIYSAQGMQDRAFSVWRRALAIFEEIGEEAAAAAMRVRIDERRG
jgi:tetratricopeptide (TPR) repeat protein